MKKLFILLLLASSAFATTPVTGNLADLSGTAVASKSKVRMWLRGCNGNQPRVIGTSIIAPTNGNTFYFDLVPNGSGVISGTIYSNDVNVSCGGQVGVTWYGMQVFVNGTPGPETCLNAVDGVTLNLNSATACTTNPVVPAPTGDTTYARLDGGNQPFTGAVLIKELVNNTYTCPIIDNTGATDVSVTAQTCFNTAVANGEELRFGKGKFLLSTAQNWTNKPGFRVSGSGAQFQISSQSPTGGVGVTIFLCNTGGICLDTTGSGDSTIKNLELYLAGTGITTPSTIGILQGRDNAGGGGGGNPFCFAERQNFENFTIIDFTGAGLNTVANGGRGYIGVYNDGAESGVYKNYGIFTATPFVFTNSNVASVSSSFQTLQTGCPITMTAELLDTGTTSSNATVTQPNIEADGTANITVLNNTFIGGGCGIKFEGAAANKWFVVGNQESVNATAYFICTGTSVRDSIFHIATAVTAFINPTANNLNFIDNYFFQETANSFPLITNTATGTTFLGGSAVISGTTSASNTTVTGTKISAPAVTNANITFNAASNYEYNGVSGLIDHGTRQATSLLATADGSLATPAIGTFTHGGVGWFVNSNVLWQLDYGATASVEFSAAQFSQPVAMVTGWSSAADPNNGAMDTGLSRGSAGVVDVGTGAQGSVAGEIRSAKISATYNAAGTVQTAVHLVQDTCTLGTSCAITFVGSAVYTSSSSYHCTATDATSAAAVKVTQASGSSVTFTGTGTDVIFYTCIGN